MRIFGDFLVTKTALYLRCEGSVTSLRIRFTEMLQDQIRQGWTLQSRHLTVDFHTYPSPRLHYTPEDRGPYDDPSLVAYSAQHKRQRVQPSECQRVRLLASGNFGRSIWALCKTDALIVFRHRNFKETVFFDGDRLVTNTKEEPTYAP
ncbi:MAG: hypothetical protein GF334_08765 [Candidatus Altiarchaeales archaeon]|nr:hypothetical protein [Candidatus Altiarchaeales archaeon]